MILIGQTIMSPNGDRNSILTLCEFSVDLSFLRSLRASQLDAIYYISDTLPLTAQDIKEMSENEKLNCLLMMVMKLQRKCDINEQMIDRKIQQQLKNHKEEIKKDISKQLVEERKRMDERLALMREETAKAAKDQNQFVVKNLSETKNENLKKKVTLLIRS